MRKYPNGGGALATGCGCGARDHRTNRPPSSVSSVMSMKSLVPGSVQEHEAELGQLKVRMGTHPFLKGMSPEDLSTLALYAMRTEFTPGQLVFKQGHIANRFYLILSGSVALETMSQDRRPVVIQTIGAGEVLGW